MAALRAETEELRDQLIARTESELACASLTLTPFAPSRGRTPQPQGPPLTGGGGGGYTPAVGSRSPWEAEAAAAEAEAAEAN